VRFNCFCCHFPEANQTAQVKLHETHLHRLTVLVWMGTPKAIGAAVSMRLEPLLRFCAVDAKTLTLFPHSRSGGLD